MIVVLFVVVVSRYRCQFDRSVWVYPFYEQEGLADPLYPLDNTLCSYKHHTTSKYRCTNLTVYLFFIFFLSQREYERGIQDCESALCVSEGSRRALYRKAICLRELGRLREAYECGTKCLLTAPHVCHQQNQHI